MQQDLQRQRKQQRVRLSLDVANILAIIIHSLIRFSLNLKYLLIYILTDPCAWGYEPDNGNKYLSKSFLYSK